MQDWFHRFAVRVSDVVGLPPTFFLAVLVILIWGTTGPLFHFSDTWQLVINTGTTIVTFLMVFLIQNTQNRDAKAIHLKLDELLRGVEGARTSMVDLEDLPDADLKKLHREFQDLRAKQLEMEREADELEREHDALYQLHQAELPKWLAAHPPGEDEPPVRS